jgi:hypothetical protein
MAECIDNPSLYPSIHFERRAQLRHGYFYVVYVYSPIPFIINKKNSIRNSTIYVILWKYLTQLRTAHTYVLYFSTSHSVVTASQILICDKLFDTLVVTSYGEQFHLLRCCICCGRQFSFPWDELALPKDKVVLYRSSTSLLILFELLLKMCWLNISSVFAGCCNQN